MKIEEFKRTELYEKFQQEDNDVGLDYEDLEVFIKDKEEVYLATGEAEGEHNAELAVEIAMKNLEAVWENIKFNRCLLIIEGDIILDNVSKGINVLMKKLENNIDIIYGTKYVVNNEKKVRVDIAVA